MFRRGKLIIIIIITDLPLISSAVNRKFRHTALDGHEIRVNLTF